MLGWIQTFGAYTWEIFSPVSVISLIYLLIPGQHFTAVPISFKPCRGWVASKMQRYLRSFLDERERERLKSVTQPCPGLSCKTYVFNQMWDPALSYVCLSVGTHWSVLITPGPVLTLRSLTSGIQVRKISLFKKMEQFIDSTKYYDVFFCCHIWYFRLLWLIQYDIREHAAHTRGWKNTYILFRGPNWAKICNLVQMLIFSWPKSKMWTTTWRWVYLEWY